MRVEHHGRDGWRATRAFSVTGSGQATSAELWVATSEGLDLRAPASELVATYGDSLAWTTTEESGFGSTATVTPRA